MNPATLNAEQIALLLQSLGVSVQRGPQRHPGGPAPQAPPSPLVAGLGLLLILMMVLRTPGVANAMMDLVQLVRLIAMGAMLVSGFMILSKVCEAPPARVAPPPRMHRVLAPPPRQRYAIVAIRDGESTARVLAAPHDDEDLRASLDDDGFEPTAGSAIGLNSSDSDCESSGSNEKEE